MREKFLKIFDNSYQNGGKASFILIFLVGMVFPTMGFAQASSACDRIYVWEFSDRDGDRNSLTEFITNQVEEILISLGCYVLVRRNYTRLKQQVENEKAILRSEQIPEQIQHLLKTESAQKVFFGQITQEYSGNIYCYFTVEELGTKRMITAQSVLLEGTDASNVNSRKKALEALLKPKFLAQSLVPTPKRYKRKSLKIHTYTPQAIAVRKGDEIIIHPSGSMTIGEWLGTSTPKGKESGLFGFPIDRYSFFPNIPHAALMYKFSEEPDNAWKYCGEKREIIAPSSGFLEFHINDKEQNDNIGAYDVEVSILQ